MREWVCESPGPMVGANPLRRPSSEWPPADSVRVCTAPCAREAACSARGMPLVLFSHRDNPGRQRPCPRAVSPPAAARTTSPATARRRPRSRTASTVPLTAPARRRAGDVRQPQPRPPRATPRRAGTAPAKGAVGPRARDARRPDNDPGTGRPPRALDDRPARSRPPVRSGDRPARSYVTARRVRTTTVRRAQ